MPSMSFRTPLKGRETASFWPIANDAELTKKFCFAILLMAMAGAGKLSADARRRPSVGRTVELRSDASTGWPMTVTATTYHADGAAYSTGSGGSRSRPSRRLLIGCRSPQRPKTELTSFQIVSEN
jgi:hypothetical protein